MSDPAGRALEIAIAIAVESHRGQRDKSGQPYILHPLRLMSSQKDSVSRQAAVLHDVVEDTSTTLDDLRMAGVDTEAVEAIRLLTRQPGRSYADYVIELKSNEVARAVKMADLQDNYPLDRVAYREHHADDDARRIQKYILTYQFLSDLISQEEYERRMERIEKISS